MRALLDLNVLIALLDADHSVHERAMTWFASHAKAGWASCPITQNGCMRIMSHPGYPNPLPVRAIMDRLAEASASAFHEFWADDMARDCTARPRGRVMPPRMARNFAQKLAAVSSEVLQQIPSLHTAIGSSS